MVYSVAILVVSGHVYSMAVCVHRGYFGCNERHSRCDDSGEQLPVKSRLRIFFFPMTSPKISPNSGHHSYTEWKNSFDTFKSMI